MKVAILGGGVIGAGWAARFLLNGWDVDVFDPDPEAERTLGAVLANARRALPALYDRALPAEGTMQVQGTLAEAVRGATWVQENVPERLDLKHAVLADALAHAPEEAVIASSTSGFKPSDLNRSGARVIVAHPFNPVYLLPLVELVGAQTDRAADLLTRLGMHPLRVRREIDAHIADRLLEAVWREALWLVKDGIATTQEIDEAIRLGFGLRWGQMGLFETYRIAGGEGGMRHFLAQFGPALAWPWTKLTDVPDLDDALVEAIASQSDAQSGGQSIAELERLRDDNLIGMIRALKLSGGGRGPDAEGTPAAHTEAGAGAGATVRAHEATLPIAQIGDLPVTVDRVVPPTWTDFNGHMNEVHYLELAGRANDRFMELIGADAAYVASGGTFFTVENHICYLDEIREGARVRVTTQVLTGEGKKMNLFHRIETEAGAVCATVESLQLHVDLATRRTAPPKGAVGTRLAEFAAAHAGMPVPAQAGRGIRAK
ncbi:MAG: carnitine 3-dehydrogenase [Pseudomonadota bacterium]